MIVFLIIYVDDILIIENDVGTLSSVKVWLSKQFDMKDLGEASHILRIKLLRNHQKNMLGLSQATYINQILARFSMEGSKKGFVPFRVGISLSSNQRPKTQAEIERMRGISYASAVGMVSSMEVSCIHAMYKTRHIFCRGHG